MSLNLEIDNNFEDYLKYKVMKGLIDAKEQTEKLCLKTVRTIGIAL